MRDKAPKSSDENPRAGAAVPPVRIPVASVRANLRLLLDANNAVVIERHGRACGVLLPVKCSWRSDADEILAEVDRAVSELREGLPAVAAR